MSTHTITMNKTDIRQLKARFPKAETRKTPPYAIYQIRLSDCVITAYESGKVVFQGNGAEYYASAYEQAIDPSSLKKKVDTSAALITERFPQAGSDEVGTGDYFGPVTVAAAYVGEEQESALRNLGIQDSKALNDKRIRTLGPILTNMLTHSLLILDNDTYNRIHPDNNMVAIKSKLHNQAYIHLRKKLGTLPDFCIIDQFVQKTSYYRYLIQEKDIVQGIHFETKAENKYLAVAAASVIARYAFLIAFDAMSEKYQFNFLKGAGYKVDQNICDFLNKYPETELSHVAKLHFANTEKAFTLKR